MSSKKRSRTCSPSPADLTHTLRRRRAPSPSLIERINLLSLEHLTTHFLPAREPHLEFDEYTIELTTANALTSDEFTACFRMLEENMKEMYAQSTLGWHPKKKKTEMRHPAMRYLLLSCSSPSRSSSSNSPAGSPTSTSSDQHKEEEDIEDIENKTTLIGFLSFMITEEEGAEVVYTYELNLKQTHQKLGLGKKLLFVVEHFGRQVGVEKAMLTVFDKNQGARRFYERERYQLDEISPGPIELRGGLLKEPTYHILSKPLR